MSKRADKGKSSESYDDIPDSRSSLKVIQSLEDILFQAQLGFDKTAMSYDNPVFAITDEVSRFEYALFGVLSVVQKITSECSLPLTGADMERANRISGKISKIRSKMDESTKRISHNVDRLTTDASDEQTHYHSRGRSKSRGSVKVHHSPDTSPEREDDHDEGKRKKKNPEDEHEEDSHPKDEDLKRKEKGGEKDIAQEKYGKRGKGAALHREKIKDESKHHTVEKDGEITPGHEGSRHRHVTEKKVPAESAIKDDRKQTNGHQTGKSPQGETSDAGQRGETAWGVPAPTKVVSSSDRGGLTHGPRRPAPAK